MQEMCAQVFKASLLSATLFSEGVPVAHAEKMTVMETARSTNAVVFIVSLSWS